VDQNIHILEKQVNPEIIQTFINGCKRNHETPRLLKLLTAMCSCRNTEISSNQDSIIKFLSGSDAKAKEASEKFVMPIEKLRKKMGRNDKLPLEI